MSELSEIQSALRHFADERNWHRYHTPKNLVMALAGEVGELLAELQWLTAEESTCLRPGDPVHDAVASEMADVMIYLLRLADVLDVDLLASVDAKMDANRNREWPV